MGGTDLSVGRTPGPPDRYYLNAILHSCNIEVVIDLPAIRRAAGVTQVELAERLGVGQGQVSRTEHQTDLLLSSLTAYLRALGVNAELRIQVKDTTITYMLTSSGENER